LTHTVHRSLCGISPSYLAYACKRRQRSTVSQTCGVTQTYSTFADRAFAAAGPGLWNSNSVAPERGGLIVQSISAVAKDIFVWIVGRRCSVNCFNCTT